MKPQFYIVAGAPGSGKSRTFPVSEFGVPFFNADDRAASLNGGSYHGISLELRAKVNLEFEAFVNAQISRRESLAIETTLRSAVTFEQILAASQRGFNVTMLYLGTENAEVNIDRIAVRWSLGYHAAPREVLNAIYAQSMKNLLVALEEAVRGTLRLILYDNTPFDQVPVPVFEVSYRSLVKLIDPLPQWAEWAVMHADFRFPPSYSPME